MEETALATIEPKDALALNRLPSLVLDEAHKAAKAINGVIEAKEKKVTFGGKTYLQFEDWQTLGRFYGVTALVVETKYVEFGDGDEKIKGFEAKANALLVSTNQMISSAEAMCLDDEPNWDRKPLFQLKSMAQTRACAKALRNVLAWVAVLAGYAGTPAEEMTGEESATVRQPQRKSQVQSTVQGTVVPANGNSAGKEKKPVTPAQLSRMFAIAAKHNVAKEDIAIYVREGYNVASAGELTMAQYDHVVTWIEAQ